MIITAGKFKGRKIAAPDNKLTRPTLSKVRMGVFNTLQSMIDFEGKTFLDMYAGSGIMGLEALSRGFSSALAIEKNPIVIKQNFEKFDPAPELLVGDSLKLNLGEFDVAYIDPPYAAGIYEQSIAAVKAKIIILEHIDPVDHPGIFKQKRYGDKIVTFITMDSRG
jgi:16S rRNA (guanine966-N2)-methyltransferase